MEDKIKTSISEVLKLVSISEDINIHEIHEYFGLSPAEIFDALSYLESNNIITIKGKKVILSSSIDEVKISKVRKLLANRVFDINDDFGKLESGDKLYINQPYIPDEKYLDEALKAVKKTS